MYPTYEQWKKQQQDADDQKYKAYEDSYRAFERGATPGTAVPKFNEEDFKGWQQWRAKNKDRLDAEYAFKGLDQNVVSRVADQFKSKWGSTYYYDMFDPEDVARMNAGQMPKYLDKTYDFNDPYDQWLYQNNLPSRDTFSDMYSQGVLDIQEEQTKRNNRLHGIATDWNSYNDSYNAFQTDVIGIAKGVQKLKGRELTEKELGDIIESALMSGKHDALVPYYSIPKDDADKTKLELYAEGLNAADYSMYDKMLEALQKGGKVDDSFFENFKESDYKKWFAGKAGFGQQNLTDAYAAALTLEQAEAIGEPEAVEAVGAGDIEKTETVPEDVAIAAADALESDKWSKAVKAHEKLINRQAASDAGLGVTTEVTNDMVTAALMKAGYTEAEAKEYLDLKKKAAGVRNHAYNKAVKEAEAAVAPYIELQNNADFATMSVAPVDTSSWDEGTRQGYYALTRNTDAATTMQEVEAIAMNKYFSLGMQMTDEEVATMNYLANTQGADAMVKYVETLEPLLKVRQMEQEQGWAKSDTSTTGGAILSSILSVPAQYGAGLEGLGSAILTLTGDDDPIDTMYRTDQARYRSNVRESVGEQLSPAGQFFYGAGMSILDNLARLPMGHAGLGIMAGDVMAEQTNAALQNGATSKQALAMGAASAAIEFITEKVSLDAILKPKMAGSAKQLVGEILKQMGIEGSEEMASELLGIFAEIAIMRGNSEWEQLVAENMAQGMTRQQAEAKAAGKKAGDILLAGFGGALSGGIMGGGNVMLTNYRYGRNAGASPTQAISVGTKAIAQYQKDMQEGDTIGSDTFGDAILDIGALPVDDATKQEMIDVGNAIARQPKSWMPQSVAAGYRQSIVNIKSLANRVRTLGAEINAKQAKVSARLTKMLDGIATAREEAAAALERGDLNAHHAAVQKAQKAMSDYRAEYSSAQAETEALKAKQAEQEAAIAEKAKDEAENLKSLVVDGAVYQNAKAAEVDVVSQMSDDIVGEMVRMASVDGNRNTYTAGINRTDSGTKLSRHARQQLRVLDGLGKKYNTAIVTHDTITRQGNDGKIYSGADNAYYDPSDGSVHVALDAEGGAYMFFAVHELVHKIETESPEMYTMLRDFVVDRLNANELYALLPKGEGNTFEQRVASVMEWYAEHGVMLTPEQAEAEIIADAIPVILTDKQTVQELVRTDRTLAERIRDFFEEFYNTLSQMVSELAFGEANKAEAAALMNDQETVREIADLFTAALESTNNSDLFNGSEENGDVRYSIGGKRAKHKNGVRWFIGFDKNKRFWFSDKESSVDFGAINNVGDSAKLEDVLDHPQLYQHYPHLRSAIVTNKRLRGAAAETTDNAISIDLQEIANRGELDRHAVLLHEVQHLIQMYEGFDSGSSRAAMQLQLLVEAFRKHEQSRHAEQKGVSGLQQVLSIYKRIGGDTKAQELYEGTLGEAEASFTERMLRSTEGSEESSKAAEALHLGPFSKNFSSEELYQLDEELQNFFDSKKYSLDDFYHGGYNKAKENNLGELHELVQNIYRANKIARGRNEAEKIPEEISGSSSFHSPQNLRLNDKAPDDGAFFDALVDAKPRSYSIKSTPAAETVIDTMVNGATRAEQAEQRLASTEAELAKVKAENERLTGRIAALKEQFTLTKGYRPNEKALKRVARNFLQQTSSTYDLGKLTEDLRSLFDMIGDQKSFDGDEAMAAANAIARRVLEKSSERDDTVYEATQEAREYFRNTHLTLSEQQRANVDSMDGGYNSFRRSLMGKMNLVNDGVPLDQAWGELCEKFPQYFDRDTAVNDQPAKVKEFLDAAYARPYVNPYGTLYDMDDAAYELASELFDEYFHLPQLQTFADKQRSKLNEANRQYRESLEAEKKAHEERYQDALALSRGMREIELKNLAKQYKEAMGDQKAEARKQYLNMVRRKNQKIDEQLATFKEWKKADRTKRSDHAEWTKYRNRILKNAKELRTWLQSPNKKKHVPAAMVERVSKLLENIDIESNVLSKKADAWRQSVHDLADMYRDYAAGRGELANSDVYFSVPDAMLDALDMLTGSVDSVQRINDLSTDELRSLDLVVAVTKSAVTSINKLYANKRYNDVATVAERTIDESTERKQQNYRSLGKLLNVDMLDSFSFGRMLGDGAASVIEALEKGAEKSYGKIHEGVQFVQKTLSDAKVKAKDVNAWSKDKVSFTLESGKDVSLTQAQLMGLYALSKRGQARQHILADGIEVSERGKDKKQLDTFTITEGDLEKMLGSLTEQQRSIMDALQTFLSKNAAEWGNETWMQLYQYEMFGEENYWPIKSAASGTKTEDPDSVRAINAMLNIGATKALVKGARNPIMLDDAFDVFSTHVAQMARLNGLAAPLEDALKWYNYVARDEKGVRDYNRVTKKAVERVFGPEGGRYFLQLIKDINSLSQGSTGTEIPSKLLSNYKRSAVAGKLRVVVQQPTAVIRATAMI
ncbi:MAG: hypothetical protein IIU73_03125, partial [Selenomonadales bacterium]|nr:hypothetical protein [Selenomonadales bacterium]